MDILDGNTCVCQNTMLQGAPEAMLSQYIDMIKYSALCTRCGLNFLLCTLYA